MNVFVDFHHAGLLNSLILLFERRLGGEVYRPIGMEWAERGFWKVYDHPATQLQYLGVGGATPDGTPKLNEVEARPTPVTYWCSDIDSGETNKAITFDGFMASDFDIVIASIPQHIEPFRRLCDMHPSHPKLIYQIGNAWNITAADGNLVDGFLASASVENPTNKPMIEYHQEFDTNLFHPVTLDVPVPKKVTSFVNCFSIDGMFAYDWELFQKVESNMNGWDFKCYGGQCRDGAMHGAKEVSKQMQESAFIWHTKVGGDGYGHVLHSAAACGKPIIARFSQYDGKLGRPLLVDGFTAINIDGLSVMEIVHRIEQASQPDEYLGLCNSMRTTFRALVDFDKEEQSISQFLSNLV